MSEKHRISIRIREGSSEYSDHVAGVLGISRSASIDILISIVSTYFTDEMLLMESAAHMPVDGRKKQQEDEHE